MCEFFRPMVLLNYNEAPLFPDAQHDQYMSIVFSQKGSNGSIPTDNTKTTLIGPPLLTYCELTSITATKGILFLLIA